MKISIFITVNNSEEFLGRCLRSISSQNFDDYEIIFLGKESDESCKKICEQQAFNNPRIKLCFNNQDNLSKNRFEALKSASGEYILFVDSNDFLNHNCISEISSKIEKYNSDLVCFSYNRVDEKENFLQKNVIFHEQEQVITEHNESLNNFRKVYFQNYRDEIINTKCFKKSLLNSMVLPDLNIISTGLDLLLITEIIINAKTVACIAEPLYNKNCKTKYLTSNEIVECMIARDAIYTRLNECNLKNDLIEIFLDNCGRDLATFERRLIEINKNYFSFNRYYKTIKRLKFFETFSERAIENDFSGSPKKTKLILNHPIALYIYRKFKKIGDFKKIKYLFSAWKIYKKNYSIQEEMSKSLYKSEYKKYQKILKSDNRKDIVFAQMKAFLNSTFILKSDRLKPANNKFKPIVFVVERNELERMKVLFEHYRKLGVEEFVILDNNSDDGTLEFLMQQEGTKVYQILEPYQTQKKEGWIEKLLAMEGMNRWCVVVDSDELLDYIGSEEHPLEELIHKSESLGYKRIWGYMVDMYSKENLFSENLFSKTSDECLFTDYFKYFDKTSYLKVHNNIYGGPRLRVFNGKMLLSKQPIFLYDENILYKRCHFLYPLIKWEQAPCWVVLRHYKFMSEDKSEYQRRITEKNFADGSSEYKTIMDQIDNNQNISMYYEGSQEYKDSRSLVCLPYLQEVFW